MSLLEDKDSGRGNSRSALRAVSMASFRALSPAVQSAMPRMRCVSKSSRYSAVEAGALGREDVTELGRILLGEAPGREDALDITLFDSTGLAVQDLAIAALVYERYRSNDADPAFAGLTAVDVG